MPIIDKLTDVDNASREFIARHKGDASGAGVHGMAHARNVGLGSEPVGRLYQLPERTLLVARFAGWLHDFKRSAGESAASTDEEESAAIAEEFLVELNSNNTFPTSPEEREAVGYAILNHGKYPDEWRDPQKRNLTPQILRDQARVLNFVPDKADANGAQVIARRSMFVAGERLHSPTGDLPQYGFGQSETDEMLVVCAESAIRLSIINPEGIYPDRLKAFVGPLYEVQRPFVAGLLRATGLNSTDLARLVLERVNAEGKSMLDVRKLDASRDIEGLSELFVKVGGITPELIDGTTPSLVDSSVRTLRYFSQRWQGDFDGVVADWRPESDIEKEWKTQMLEYNDGSWFGKITQQITGRSNG